MSYPSSKTGMDGTRISRAIAVTAAPRSRRMLDTNRLRAQSGSDSLRS
jgi:hypothetical protein